VAPKAARFKDLRLRLASALVLLVVVIGSLVVGAWAFTALCLLVALLAGWEWIGLTDPPDPCAWRWQFWGDAAALALVSGVGPLLVLTLGAEAIQTGGAPWQSLLWAWVVATLFFIVRRVLGFGQRVTNPSGRLASHPFVTASGLLLIWGATVIIIALREVSDHGFALVLVLFFTVWATDSGAYLFGRAIGGPRLWPQVSPNKTWAGVFGGLLAGTVTGVVVSGLLVFGTVSSGRAAGPMLISPWVIIILSFATQLGDLGESALKRLYGAKDAGDLIPGHGGALDRIDGLIVAAWVLAILSALHV
jgi:phosphatidate cytidylyltransferase